MNITTIVTQMTILLLIMIVGFVGAKKNIFNDEVNVYASNILLKIGIPGLIISSVKNGSPFTGINVNLKMYSFDHLRMYNIDHINTCCSRR